MKIKKGNKLTDKEIIEINKIFQKEFPGNEPINKKKKKLFAKDIFFIVYVNYGIASVGRLRPVKLIFKNKKYAVLGIADMVSVIKRRGYGKQILKAMDKYSKKMKIGFCRRKNSLFYIKSGLIIAKDLVKNFVYYNKGKIIKNNWDNDVIYSKNAEKFIEEVKISKKDVKILSRHW